MVFALFIFRVGLIAIFCLWCCCGTILVILAHVLRIRNGEEGDLFGGGKKGATKEVIDALPLHRYETPVVSEAEGGEASSECAICIDDFTVGDELRRLPCGHSFHRACVDKWLMIDKTCPLCKRDVTGLEDVTPASPGRLADGGVAARAP